jgi:hypothetical protein
MRSRVTGRSGSVYVRQRVDQCPSQRSRLAGVRKSLLISPRYDQPGQTATCCTFRYTDKDGIRKLLKGL